MYFNQIDFEISKANVKESPYCAHPSVGSPSHQSEHVMFKHVLDLY